MLRGQEEALHYQEEVGKAVQGPLAFIQTDFNSKTQKATKNISADVAPKRGRDEKEQEMKGSPKL